MIICCDFDGVIHDPTNRDPHRRMGKPVPGALEAIEYLVACGHKVLVHTARVRAVDHIAHVADWLDYFGFPTVVAVCAFKPMADVYLDDKGMRFDDWNTSLAVLTGRGARVDFKHGQARTSEQAAFPAVESARRAREHYDDNEGYGLRPGNH